MVAVWHGSLTFSLVNIPIRLHPAARDRSVTFRQVHGCGGRIRHRRVCEREDREVPLEEIIRGYDTGGQLVPLDEEDLDRLPLPTQHRFEIAALPAEQVPPTLWGRAYYAQPHPANGAERAYVLLRDTMTDAEHVAIGQIALRQREHLAMLRPERRLLVLQLLYWPSDLNDPSPFEPAPVEIPPRERHLARTLLDALRDDFHPDHYRDHYRDAVDQLVDAKIAGRLPHAAPADDQAPADLAAALETALVQARASKRPRRS
ncbi:hypothetical protein MOQ72_41500 [Saccharopolyspora sp. K220]|uniref:non-homologous end joining protein Ku n=1 Tax=Saccharopolyspora soli TaxID=2926618 RepID=UPI001F5750CC|nr:Ku protein [Saccharopolyspora soli]MCI2423895.1 hypothetical protein [Saccharopolyspora soli]